VSAPVNTLGLKKEGKPANPRIFDFFFKENVPPLNRKLFIPQEIEKE
jgi:hypothetical protein